MKRMAGFICFLLILIGMASCNQKESFVEPVVFYYPRSEFGIGKDDSVISQEIREGTQLNVNKLLDSYFLGPLDAQLANPFPEGTRLISMNTEELTLYLTLSDEFASLAGIELTVACASIAKTCKELTGAETVVIRAETMLINGYASVTADGRMEFVDNGAQHTQTTAPN